MISLATAALALLPLYPLNPARQDTVSSVNMHFTANVAGPNAIIGAGFGSSIKCEMLVVHPLVLRGALEYEYGSILSRHYPRGSLHTVTGAVELLLYRGTDKLNGFIGGGAFVSANMFQLRQYSADSLRTYEQIEDVDMSQAVGYRFIFGLRFNRAYSIELAFSDTRPDYIFTQRLSTNSFARYREPLRLNDVRISFGYLLTLNRL